MRAKVYKVSMVPPKPSQYHSIVDGVLVPSKLEHHGARYLFAGEIKLPDDAIVVGATAGALSAFDEVDLWFIVKE